MSHLVADEIRRIIWHSACERESTEQKKGRVLEQIGWMLSVKSTVSSDLSKVLYSKDGDRNNKINERNCALHS